MGKELSSIIHTHPHPSQPSLVISMQPWESLVKVQTLKPEFLFKSQIEPNRQVTLNTMLHLSSLSFFPCKMGIIMVLKPEVCSENYVSTSMLRTTWKSRADSHRVYSNTATDIPGVWPSQWHPPHSRNMMFHFRLHKWTCLLILHEAWTEKNYQLQDRTRPQDSVI